MPKEEERKLNEQQDTEDLETVCQILKKRAKNSDDLEYLDTYFTKVKFFADSKAKVDKESFYKLLKCLQYERLKGHEILFRKGDKGDKFYIILKGSVKVMIPKPESEIVFKGNMELLKVAKLFDESVALKYARIEQGGNEI